MGTGGNKAKGKAQEHSSIPQVSGQDSLPRTLNMTLEMSVDMQYVRITLTNIFAVSCAQPRSVLDTRRTRNNAPPAEGPYCSHSSSRGPRRGDDYWGTPSLPKSHQGRGSGVRT